MKYLIIDAGGVELALMDSVQIETFTSNPPSDGSDPCGDRGLRPLTQDVEDAIGRLVDREGQQWKGTRDFIVAPLQDAYKAITSHRSSVQVSATGGRP